MSTSSTPPLRLTESTKVHDLITAYPFLIEELGRFNPHYRALQDPQMRAMMAGVATLEMAAMRGGVEVSALMNFVADAIQRHTGHLLLADSSLTQQTDPERLAAFREIMIELHSGGDLATAQRKFSEMARGADPGEIAEMEQHLIREGMPVSEIKRMCDAHLQVVQQSVQKREIHVPAGHPLDTFLRENRRIGDLVAMLRGGIELLAELQDSASLKANWRDLDSLLAELAEIDRHYARKEHQLFSFLERKGFTGPSQVMWAVHDDIRAQLKATRHAIADSDFDQAAALLPSLLNAVSSMIQKEETILFPTSMQLLEDADWETIREGEREIGFMSGCAPQEDSTPAPAAPKSAATDGLLAMNVGALSLEQLNLIVTHLPVELSFVDEHDTVRFYSNQPHKIFARTPEAIGRKVQNCHPPKSVHLVNQILSDFRGGTRDRADFWIEMNGVFVYIRYFAVRDAQSNYRGSLEVVQDVTEIRKLEGERRLLAEAEA